MTHDLWTHGDPAKMRGRAEAAIQVEDDGTVQALVFRYATISRSRFQATFPVLVAVRAWGLEDFASGLSPLGEWLRCMDRLRFSPWGDFTKPRWILAEARDQEEALAGGRHVIERVLSSTLASDRDHGTARRAEEDRRAALLAARTGLQRAATHRGVGKVERDFAAALEGLRDAWEGCGGPDVAAMATEASALIQARRSRLV